MDSLSQFTLGAAVGEAIFGKKIGGWGILIGGLAGTIPDLDVFFLPLFDEIAYLTIHRGYTHSILFSVLMSPLFAWPLQKLFAKKGTTYSRWVLFFFLAFFTHAILDSLTTFGTQLFLPFSDMRVGFNNIFVVDPFYTIPFTLSIIICLFIKRTKKARRIVNWAGISLSCFYLLVSLVNKNTAANHFISAMETQGIEYERMMVGTTPLNILLWYNMAETEDGYYTGYYSVFDKTDDLKFTFIPRNDHLLEGMKSFRIVDRLIWFSKGYYAVREKEDHIEFYALIFGRANIEGETELIFPSKLRLENGELQYEEGEPNIQEMDTKELINQIIARIKGI